MKAVFSSLFLMAVVLGQAQNPELIKYQEAYPKEDLVTIKDYTEYEFFIEDGEVKMKTRIYVEKLYLNGEAPAYSKYSVSYSGFTEIDKIKARTLVPKENGKYKTKKVKSFTTKDEFTSGIFHDDVVSLNFSFPQMTEGCRTILEYTKKYNEGHLLSGEYFIYFYPTVLHTAKFIIPNNIKVKLNTFHFDETIKTEDKQEGGNRIVTISTKLPEKAKYETATPSFSYFAPHVIPQIISYEYKGKEVKMLGGVDDLFAWYNSLVKSFNDDESSDLENIVDSLTKGLETDFDKTKAIFYWVQEKIKYVAFEDGLGGFVPRSAMKVCDRRFGDCKDMASIITKMMSYADVEGFITWIGSRDIPYTYTELPTPNVDNHMIASFKHNGEFIFLDATNEFIPIGRPSGFTQGKEAMIKTGEDSYEIVTVPTMAPETNQRSQNIQLKFDGEDLVGNGELTLTGYIKGDHRRTFENLNKKDEEQALDVYLELGNNKFGLEDYKIENMKDKEKDTKINYSFRISSYARFHKDEIFVNMSMDEIFERKKLDDDRKYPYAFRFLSNYNSNYTLAIPEGYKAEYIPKDVEFETDAFVYKCSYKLLGDKLYFFQTMSIKTMLVEPSLFNEWNEFVSTAKKAQNESIILKKQ